MCFAREFPFQVSAMAVASAFDRQAIELRSRDPERQFAPVETVCVVCMGSYHPFRALFAAPLPSSHSLSLSLLSASPTMTLVTRYLPHPRPADGFHTDVPKGIGPRWCTIIRLWNRGDAQSSITVINFAVRATNRRRFNASLVRLHTSQLPRDIS